MTLTDIANHAEEIEALKAERDALAKEVDAANDRNAELIEERDALVDQVAKLESDKESLLGMLTEKARMSITMKEAEIRAEAIKEFLRALEYAPSSPVSAVTAFDVSLWWDKFSAAKARQGGAE